MRLLPIVLAGIALVGAGPLLAASDKARAALFGEVTACQKIQDSTARLQCYDRAVAALDTAERSRDIVVVDREQIRETRRTLFGLAVPDLAILRGKDARTDKAEEVNQIDGVVASAATDRYGHWTFRLVDGAVWRQLDDNVVAARPRPGDKLVIKRGALGSFRMSVAGQPPVKVRRDN